MKFKKLSLLTSTISALALTSTITVVSCADKKEPVQEVTSEQYLRNLEQANKKLFESFEKYGEKDNYNRDEILKIIKEAKILANNKSIKVESDWNSEKADKVQKALTALMNYMVEILDTIAKELPKKYNEEKLNKITKSFDIDRVKSLAETLQQSLA